MQKRQKFTQWWIWVLLLGVNAMIGFGVFKQIIQGHPFGDRPASNNQMIAIFIVIILVTILFFSIKLETVIKEDGIYVRFFPLQIAYRKYTWERINKSFLRKYNPIGEFGGWGFRYGNRNGKALNISGNRGLQLIFTDNSRLLIGTNKAEELETALIEIGQLKQ